MKIINCLTLVMVSFNVLAATEKADDVRIVCSFPDGYSDKLPTKYKELQQEAMKVGTDSCKNLLNILPSESSVAPAESMNRFASDTKRILDQIFPDSTFPGMEDLSTKWVSQVSEYRNDYRYFDFIQDGNLNINIEGQPPTVVWQVWLRSDDVRIDYRLDGNQKAACNNVVPGGSCLRAFTELQNAVSPFQYPFSIGVLEDNGKKLASLQKDWNTFIDDSRYQTPLDVWVTTRYYNDRFNGKDLVGPPNTQLFLLHPALVYERIDNADKGDRDDISLAIEWAGINWWKSGFGFSLTSTYRDQANVRSVGNGITLHIRNKYSFGFVNRGHGDNSFFFNLDVLEWFGDKKEKYEKYKAHTAEKN